MFLPFFFFPLILVRFVALLLDNMYLVITALALTTFLAAVLVPSERREAHFNLELNDSSFFLLSSDSTIITTALPTISADLKGTGSDYSWVGGQCNTKIDTVRAAS